MDKEVIDQIIEAKPALKKARGKLEKMQAGSYCLHRSWGFGQIQSYDAAQGKLMITFYDENRENHPMDPAFCVDKLDILSESNVLVLKHTKPEETEELIKKDPVKIITTILSQDDAGIASTTEIVNILNQLMGEAKAKKWWTATKKLLVQEPSIGVPSKKNGNYELREDPIKPEEEILEEFYLNKKPKKKILLAEKLYQLSGDVEVIANDLPVILETLTDAVKDSMQLTQAERLHGVWVRNNLARHLHEDVETLEPTSTSLIEETKDLAELARELPSTYYKRFLDLLTRVYPEKWQRITFNLLMESEGRLTNECINFLVEQNLEKQVIEHLNRWLSEQVIEGPVLFWMIKNRQSKKYGPIVQNMINTQLLSCVISAIDNIALHNDSTRRIPLADLLSEDTELIPEILDKADKETATDLAQTLLINQGFDDLTKKSILARFIRKFPSIQELISGSSKSSADESKLIVSQESYDKRLKELDELVTVLIPDNKKAIAVAREHGDLRENAEYHMAKDDQKVLDARRGKLEADLSRSSVTDFSDAREDEVGIGSMVELLEGSTGNIQNFTILGAWDSAPEKNIVSYKTPLAASLTGKKIGEEVTVNVNGTEENWTIKSIARWVDLVTAK